jgi:multiple antibiotic resistance protein
VLLYSSSMEPFTPQGWILLGIVALVIAVTIACLLASAGIARLVGQTGANVISRLLGLVLSALATQFVLDGLQAFVAEAGLV